MRVTIVISGTSPLLMNRMPPDQLEALWAKTKPAKSAQRPSMDVVAASKVYVNAAGEPVMPKENLMGCLIEAGKYVRLDGKRQVSTGKSSMLGGMLTIDSDELLLKTPSTTSPGGWGVAEWRYEIRQGRNPNGGEAVAIVRPRFESWAFCADIDIDTNQMPEGTFRELFDIAGKRVGLCDFRPARKGIFGQFRVDLWSPERVGETIPGGEGASGEGREDSPRAHG